MLNRPTNVINGLKKSYEMVLYEYENLMETYRN